MRELKELICYFLTHSPHRLTTTQIVKMIYMFEYYHVQTFGNQYTNITFIRYKHGPFAQEIYDEIDNLLLLGDIEREVIEYPNKRLCLHELINNNVLEEYALDESKKYIADRVIYELENKSHNEMLNFVYSTPPMLKIIREEEGIGSKLNGEVLNMKECKPIKKFSRERIEAARMRLDKSSRGTDAEYYAHLLKEKSELDLLRRRANQCLLK